MCEGASRISGPIPPDPTLFPDCYRRPASARGRLEGTDLRLDFLPGPLAPDPTLYPSCYSARPAQPVPRIRPNARNILERGNSGTVGVLLKLEGISLHGPPQSPPLRKAKDHGKENVRRMREIQKRCREKELERVQGAPTPVRALWKSTKYENVESKVKARLQEPPPAPRPASAGFLKSHSRSSTGVPPKRPNSPGPGRPSITDAMEVHGSSIDFVSHNARNAKTAQIRRSRSMQSLNEVLGEKVRQQQEYDAKQKGHVPQYLLELKEKWLQEKEEMKKRAPDPSMPAGHTMMPEHERQETLQKLAQTQSQLTKDLLMIPLRADTLSNQNRRTELEKKLSEIEEAIKVFSRPKVFIKIDS